MQFKQCHTREDLLEVLESEAPSKIRQAAIKIIMSSAFDYCMGVVILANVAVMIIETDDTANDDELQGGSSSWTEPFGWVALLVFVLELLLRMFAMRSIFWKDVWNVADFSIVSIDVFFSLLGIIIGDTFPISILRIFRLAKLARISKLFRVFPELRVLMAGLAGSLRAIFWGMILLIFVLLVWSMVAVLFIHPLAKNLDFDGCTRCPHAYDSVARAMLTFWQQIVAGDSWGAATIPVIEAHPSSVLFFIPMFMMVGMAVMNLILGVVVEVALTAKSQIEREDDTEKTIERMETTTHLMDVCHHIDTEGEGEICKEEAFANFLQPGDFRDSILSLDVTEEDFSVVWAIVDEKKSGKVSYKDLISRLYAVRSSDTQFMLSYIKYYITIIKNDLTHTMQLVESKLADEMKEVEAEVQILEGDLQTKENHQEQNLAVETQPLEPSTGAWQALEETVQKTPALRSQESEERPQSNQTIKSSAPMDTLGGWNNQLCHEIEALQFELKHTLMNLTQSLQSQVSLVSTMNLKMTMIAPNMSLCTI